MRKPTISVATSGITTTGMIPAMARGTFTRRISSTTAPASRPATRPPRNPAGASSDGTCVAIAPPTMPGTSAGRSPMANAMNPARIGTRNPKAIPPIWNIRAAHDWRLPQLKPSVTDGASTIS